MRKTALFYLFNRSLLITGQADEPKKSRNQITKSGKKVEEWVTVQIKKEFYWEKD